MRIGVFTALLADMKLGKALDYLAAKGINTVEIGTGNYPGNPHCPLDDLLKSDQKLTAWKDEFAKREMTISALSCHGNPLHPDKNIAKKHHDVQRKTVLLAEKLGLKTIVTFSGCPGGGPSDKTPNWITCPWPPDFEKTLKWQWDKKVVPYWKKENQFGKDHGVRYALEAHPGFVVYNPETILKLRKEAGKQIGANLDPSHFFWQGIDPIAAARTLGEAVFYVHAKDTRVDPINAAQNGVLDNKHYGNVLQRGWSFRTCGYGHSEQWWRDFVSTLVQIGYNDVLSIEHEDPLMTPDEGLTKAITFLKALVIEEKAGAMWWA